MIGTVVEVGADRLNAWFGTAAAGR
jgi:hypothetical protein